VSDPSPTSEEAPLTKCPDCEGLGWVETTDEGEVCERCEGLGFLNLGFTPPGTVELDGVTWCVLHSGVVSEGADYVDENGDPACDMRSEGDEPCRWVPLYIRADQA
jgi:hypothetical protein